MRPALEAERWCEGVHVPRHQLDICCVTARPERAQIPYIKPDNNKGIKRVVTASRLPLKASNTHADVRAQVAIVLLRINFHCRVSGVGQHPGWRMGWLGHKN